jgi:serine/threonine protein kinase
MSTETPMDPDRTVVLPSSAPGHHLAIGTRMAEFEIVGLIGEGGFGIVYLAHDHSLGRNVALKEYMPSELAQRTPGGAVAVKSPRHAESFGAGLRSFVNEARLLAQFDHPSLVKVYRFWEANGAAYMVMPYYEGATLREVIRRSTQPPAEAWLKTLLEQLLDALEILHNQQCYHRDIAPDNILMLADDKPLLLDFGAARRVINDSAQALTIILKPGYAPIEQYAEAPNMKQGPWTDLYALASVVYFAITGQPPVPAVARVAADPLVPLAEAAAGRYSDAFLRGIDAALAVLPDERPVSIAEFRDALGFGLLQTHPALREYGSVTAAAPDAATPSPLTRRNEVTAGLEAGLRTGQPKAGGATDAAGNDGQLEKLLARYIGPMAKIIVGRARKSANTPAQLIRALADAVDDEKQRTEFVREAAEIVERGKPPAS